MLLVLAALMCSTHAVAQTQPHDTVYLYENWRQMFAMMPDALIVDPFIETVSPYELEVYLPNDELNEIIHEKYIAISLGDSIMLMNASYLKDNFSGDAKKLSGFVPVFYNERVAYAIFSSQPSVKNYFIGITEGDELLMDYYYIDFVNRKVRRMTPSALSKLLEDYHDLQMRYEGMKDYKKRVIIEDYFLKYVDRATEDFMRPYILDIVE